MLNKRKTFKGGYTFRTPKITFSERVETLSIPERVVIPLSLRFSSKITPLVQKGDKVQAGQIIARDDETVSTPAIASVNGIVEDIRQIDCHYGKVAAVVIRSDGSSEYKAVEGATENFEKLSSEKINEILYLSGVTALGKSGIPTSFKSSPVQPKSINNLIVTTFGTGPFSPDQKILLKGSEDRLYKGISILKKAFPDINVTIVLDSKDKVFQEEMINIIKRSNSSAKTSEWIFIQPLDKKYPQESEDMLARTILDEKVPIGGFGVDVGTLMLGTHEILRVYDAVVEGKPLIENTISLSGSACKEGKYINLRVGTSIENAIEGNIKENIEGRIIFGGTMSGLVQKDLSMPVGRSIGHITVLEEYKEKEFLAFMRPGLDRDSYSNAFLSAVVPCAKSEYNTNMHGEGRPCVQCGYCDEVCPVGIYPHLLSKHIKHDICEETEQLGIFECIDCGLCSYVCPCKIPLTDHITKGKRTLIEEGCTVFRVKTKESEEAVKAYRGRMPL